jgi:hypothetical protein
MGTIVHRPQRLLRSNSDCVLRNGKKLPALWLAEAPWGAKEKEANVHPRPAVLDLPDELLEAIIPHMDHKDLFALSQVCRRLNELAVRGSWSAMATPSNAKCCPGTPCKVLSWNVDVDNTCHLP